MLFLACGPALAGQLQLALQGGLARRFDEDAPPYIGNDTGAAVGYRFGEHEPKGTKVVIEAEYRHSFIDTLERVHGGDLGAGVSFGQRVRPGFFVHAGAAQYSSAGCYSTDEVCREDLAFLGDGGASLDFVIVPLFEVGLRASAAAAVGEMGVRAFASGRLRVALFI